MNKLNFKNKKTLIIVLSLFLALIIAGTTIAVLSIPRDNYDYLGKQIHKGVYYQENQVTTYDGKNVNTFVLTISSSNKNLEVVTGVPDDETPLTPGFVQTTTYQALSAQMSGKYVVGAINADYFHMGKHDKIQPCSVTIKDGELLTEFNETRWDRGCFFGIKNDGTAVLGDEKVYNQVKNDLYQAVGGGPWLVKKGVAAPFEEDGGRHPRTAVGILENGSVIMMVADGRSEDSVGFSYKELSDYMVSLGCVEAINLDGGGSTTMVINNTEDKFDYLEIKNDPSDNSERDVGNTLLVIDKSKKSDIN